MALTRSKARELTQQLSSAPLEEQTPEIRKGEPEAAATGNESAMRAAEQEMEAMVDEREAPSVTHESEDIIGRTGQVCPPTQRLPFP
ncbi:hypothetical protein HPB52_008593 [Rhipicephalus sanguineus]|uniref:Uncharacterized protein n=1 Tax=Rhipicephalus sanguineus TaxID=34632 RepID=A0A9D4PWB7_RHISA|nr:hypothetical protein HPB52_008593 [Rhipicephalus sanguineus]